MHNNLRYKQNSVSSVEYKQPSTKPEPCARDEADLLPPAWLVVQE